MKHVEINTQMAKNVLAQMNYIFLCTMKCHNPVAGTYSKAIMMFDLYSKRSLERVKNCVFQICELYRDDCYKKHNVRGWIPSEVASDGD